MKINIRKRCLFTNINTCAEQPSEPHAHDTPCVFLGVLSKQNTNDIQHQPRAQRRPRAKECSPAQAAGNSSPHLHHVLQVLDDFDVAVPRLHSDAGGILGGGPVHGPHQRRDASSVFTLHHGVRHVRPHLRAHHNQRTSEQDQCEANT